MSKSVENKCRWGQPNECADAEKYKTRTAIWLVEES